MMPARILLLLALAALLLQPDTGLRFRRKRDKKRHSRRVRHQRTAEAVGNMSANQTVVDSTILHAEATEAVANAGEESVGKTTEGGKAAANSTIAESASLAQIGEDVVEKELAANLTQDQLAKTEKEEGAEVADGKVIEPTTGDQPKPGSKKYEEAYGRLPKEMKLEVDSYNDVESCVEELANHFNIEDRFRLNLVVLLLTYVKNEATGKGFVNKATIVDDFKRFDTYLPELVQKKAKIPYNNGAEVLTPDEAQRWLQEWKVPVSL